LDAYPGSKLDAYPQLGAFLRRNGNQRHSLENKGWFLSAAHGDSFGAPGRAPALQMTTVFERAENTSFGSFVAESGLSAECLLIPQH